MLYFVRIYVCENDTTVALKLNYNYNYAILTTYSHSDRLQFSNRKKSYRAEKSNVYCNATSNS